MKRLLACLAMTLSAAAPAQDKPFALAIHGGAGTITRASMTPEKEAAYRATLPA